MAKILIVEDDLAFNHDTDMAQKKGFEVERATSVKSALHFFEDNSHWDLVLSDLELSRIMMDSLSCNGSKNTITPFLSSS